VTKPAADEPLDGPFRLFEQDGHLAIGVTAEVGEDDGVSLSSVEPRQVPPGAIAGEAGECPLIGFARGFTLPVGFFLTRPTASSPSSCSTS